MSTQRPGSGSGLDSDSSIAATVVNVGAAIVLMGIEHLPATAPRVVNGTRTVFSAVFLTHPSTH